MSEFINALAYFFVIGGAVAIVIGLIGVYRMPDFFTRLHAASIVDTLGTIFIIFGLLLYSGINLVSAKLILIMLFVLITTPAAAHALAKSALHGNLRPMLDGEE
ncbi:MAG: monovalent cation/H(+) antiporter subunit G [Proteobacteria bacterium]|nr:monovalent cation/H(+) antiporter subunit G [Pseudomonadota bacterium]